MSFASDLLRGNFSNLGHDIAPSNILSDAGPDFKKSLPYLAAAAGVALPFLAPEALGALGIGGAADAAAGGGAAALGGAGAADATAGVPLDILAGSASEGTAGLAGLGDIIPAAGSAGAGLAPELTSAGFSGFPSAVPGITAGLGTVAPGGAIPGTEALGFAPAGQGGIGSDFAANSTGLPSIITSGTSGGGTGILDSVAAAGAGGASPLDLSGSSLPFDLTGNITSGLSSAGSGTLNWLKANPLMAASLGVGGASLLKSYLGSKSALPYQPQLESAAGNLQQQGQELSGEGQGLLGPIQGGPLPPALEAQVTNSLNDAITTTKARYAQLGLSGSTMESDQIANLQQQAEGMRGTLALQLAQAGNSLINTSASDFSSGANIYTQLMQTQISQDSALEQSIANFAGQAAMASALMNRPAAKAA